MNVNPRISVLTGDAARSWMEDEKNLADWRKLYAACGWGTTFQTPDFFRAWFRHYGAQWRPVLALGLGRDHLNALMPLAAANGMVTGVGAHQAEYHGWLAGGDSESGFLKDAVAKVLTALPNHELRLRYLPPGAPAAALKVLLDGDRRAFAQTHTRPLLALAEAQINDVLRKKGNRSKISRLKRLGPFAIRKIEADELAQRIDEISAMCDFRQGAVNDSCPFLDDPRKGAFHLDWARDMACDVHVSGMFVAGKLASILIFALSKHEAHIAITAHAPEHAANSPAKIHIYEAALALAREGFATIDMTPGDDEWKLRFATETDQVIDLTVFGNARRAALVRARGAIGATARSAVARAGFAIAAINRIREGLRVRKLRPSKTGDASQEAISYDLVAPAPSDEPSATHAARVNDLGDLLRDGPRLTGMGRQAFLRQALARMEAGARCYSLNGPRGLAGIGWSGTAAGDKPAVQVFDFAAATGEDARLAYAAIIRRMLSDLKSETSATTVRASPPSRDSALRATLERLGFQRDRP